MTLSEQALQAHLNMTGQEAYDLGGPILRDLLAAAKAHTEAQLGFRLTDATEFPDGLPDDVALAVLMLAAHWFNEREAAVAGVSIVPIPFGYADIIASHRRYTFG